MMKWTMFLVGILASSALLACGSDGTAVRFPSGEISLAGTILRPEVEGPVPAVVLIHGSGETDRSTMSHYAAIFVENGYAALIYDKRGVGESQGESDAWRNFDFEQLAADAAAGVECLAQRDDVDANRIGLFGASQGAWVAPLAATRSDRVAFMVLLSASVSTVAEDRLFERAARLRSEGFEEDEIAEVTAMQLVDQQLTRSGEGFEDFARLWEQNHEKRWFRRVYLGDAPTPADDPWRLWYRRVLDFDPVPLLEELSIPALWLFGDPALDRFGPVERSVATLGRLQSDGKDYEIEVYPGADHNLWIEESGRDAPYRERIARWLDR